MNKFRLPLKLSGDRLLFIVITWVFSVTLSVFINMVTGGKNPNIGLYYSIITAVPYTALIYYESYDVGSREHYRDASSMKKAFIYCLIWQIPSLVLFLLFLLSFVSPISTGFINGIFGGIWLAPYIGPRGSSPAQFANAVQYIVFMLLEWSVFMVSYYLGSHDIVLIKTKKKSAKGTVKK